jgi:hypothetical protein
LAWHDFHFIRRGDDKQCHVFVGSG